MTLNNSRQRGSFAPGVYSSGEAKFKLSIANEVERAFIYQLRHTIYAEELGQHQVNEAGCLRDDLDLYNTYIVAKENNKVVGFVSVTVPGSSAFSVDKYFDRLLIPYAFDQYLYEIRLLSVAISHRNSSVALLLMYAAKRFVEAHGGKHIVAICRSSLMKMYIKAGLDPLHHSVKSGRVVYELSATSIEKLDKIICDRLDTFRMLEEKTEWSFPYAFFTPAACYHGGSFFKAIGEDLQTLDLKDSIINADVLDAWFPPSPKVIFALQNNLPWLLQTSPPTHNEGLIGVIARERGVDMACILPGAGSSDLIFLGLQNLLTAASRVLILDPCYGEYRYVLDHIIHCRVSTFALKRANGFAVDTDALLEEILKGYDIVILINPNSPTGLHVAKESMKKMLSQVPASTLVWIDETYIEYAEDRSSLEQYAVGTENVMICKSMSKVYALSGARAAYLCSSPHLIETLRSLTPPWAVSLPAQLAAITALQDGAYYRERYIETHKLRKAMQNDLLELGITEIIEGSANFLLFYLPQGSPSTSDFIKKCKTEGLFIRDVSNMGNTLGMGAIRVAIKDSHTNDRIISIMRGALN